MVIQPLEFWFSFGSFVVRIAKVPVVVVDRIVRVGACALDLVPTLPSGVEAVYAMEGAGGDDLPRLQLLPNAIRYVTSPWPYPRQYITISGTFEGYLGKFGSKTRQTLRRKIAKFARGSGGTIVWKQYKRADEMAEFHRLASEVVATTYQKRVYGGGIPDDPRFRAELERAAAVDGIRGYILFFDGKPIAYHYAYAVDDILICSKVGYDPAYAHYNAGTVLLYLLLEQMFGGDRFKHFDFGRGEFAYKERYGTCSRPCHDVFYFRKTFRNFCFVALHYASGLLAKAVGDAFAAIGLKARIKEAIRTWSFRRYHGVHASSAGAAERP